MLRRGFPWIQCRSRPSWSSYLPYLVKGAKFVGEETGKAFAHEGWEAAQRLWGKLRSRFVDNSDELKTAEKLADNPDDELDWSAVAFQLRELLDADPELNDQLEEIWRETEPARKAVAAERGVAVTGDVRNSVIVTGDDVNIDR